MTDAEITLEPEGREAETTLRAANIARQAIWCPEQVPDLSFRGNELAGETGEVCNVIKKLERERLGWRGSRDTVEHLAEELADVVICADLVAIAAGIDLDAAVEAKFNATSEKVGLPTRLALSRSTLPREGQGEVDWPPLVKLGRTLGFFASAIKSGEPWTETCQREYDAANLALQELYAALSPSPAVRDGVVLVALNADGEERATIRFEDDPWPIAEFIEWMKGWQESDPSRVVTARALSTREQGNG